MLGSRFGRLSHAVLREGVTIAVTILGLLAVTFLIARVMPVDPVLAVVGDNARPEVYERAYREMGLDKPVIVQFWIYLGKVFSGDFGRSVLTSNLVIDDIRRVFPATLELATLGTLIGVTLGIPLGVLAATRQGRWQDHVARFIGLFGYSIPIFWLGLMGLLVFYAKLGWVSGPGRIAISYQDFVTPITGILLLDCALQGEWEAFRNAFSHLILPSAVLGLFSTAYISRMTRSFMITELQQHYVITARVKGLSEGRVVWGHALRNALVPLLTVIALSYANLLEGSVLTETVFAWPGLGRYITNSLLNADMNAVLGGTIVVGLIFVGINILTDILARAVDPRAR
ncbi:MAG: ABC transporter permease [Hyphomicrobiales bacterium]|uniref:ABC transporter permease n=1 Tax=Rhabdaerophilum calidifontis TaxID=2604328 RepID=UPI001FE7E36B|nr:ABC transporter permease [Rhabdaerophilum calidifontis]MCA1952730.1 ABC transporter permease [Hyphomicrobiales bacterium]MCA1998929.1 ABC transporter permease [Hyphomicrobiales bacterium]